MTMADKGSSRGSSGRLKRGTCVSTEEKKERKRDLDRERQRARICIGDQIGRWLAVKLSMGLSKNEDVAKMLLDSWCLINNFFMDDVNNLTSPPNPLTSKQCTSDSPNPEKIPASQDGQLYNTSLRFSSESLDEAENSDLNVRVAAIKETGGEIDITHIKEEPDISEMYIEDQEDNASNGQTTEEETSDINDTVESPDINQSVEDVDLDLSCSEEDVSSQAINNGLYQQHFFYKSHGNPNKMDLDRSVKSTVSGTNEKTYSDNVSSMNGTRHSKRLEKKGRKSYVDETDDCALDAENEDYSMQREQIGEKMNETPVLQDFGNLYQMGLNSVHPKKRSSGRYSNTCKKYLSQLLHPKTQYISTQTQTDKLSQKSVTSNLRSRTCNPRKVRTKIKTMENKDSLKPEESIVITNGKECSIIATTTEKCDANNTESDDISSIVTRTTEKSEATNETDLKTTEEIQGPKQASRQDFVELETSDSDSECAKDPEWEESEYDPTEDLEPIPRKKRKYTKKKKGRKKGEDVDDNCDSVEQNNEKKISSKRKPRKKKGPKMNCLPGSRRSDKYFPDIKVQLEDHQDKYDVITWTSHCKKDRGVDTEHKSFHGYGCRLCQGVFKTTDRSVMEVHIKEHMQGKLTCGECGLVFSYYTQLRKHRLKLHVEAKYTCEECGEQFHYIKVLHTHLSKVHNKKVFQCKKCQIYFQTHAERKAHSLEVHPECFEKCKVCGETINITLCKDAMERHMRSYWCQRTASSICEICGKEVQRLSIKTHIRRVHHKTKTLSCDICGFSTHLGSTYKLHMMTHTGEHPVKCSLCDFSCIRTYQLTSHMRTHTGHKPYKCDQCSYASAWNVQLKDHKKAHLSDDKVNCDTCNITFKDRRGLNMHISKEHSSNNTNDLSVARENHQSTADSYAVTNSVNQSREDSYIVRPNQSLSELYSIPGNQTAPDCFSVPGHTSTTDAYSIRGNPSLSTSYGVRGSIF